MPKLTIRHICGFLCPHIVRCAVIHPELILRSPILNDVLGSRLPFESFFQQYWKHNDKRTPTECLTDHRQKIARHHASQQPELRTGEILKESENNFNPSIDIEQDVAGETKTYMSWADGEALYDNLHRLASAIGPIALESLRVLLQNAAEAFSKGNLSPPSSIDILNDIHSNTSPSNRIQDKYDLTIHQVKNPISSLTKKEKRKKMPRDAAKDKTRRQFESIPQNQFYGLGPHSNVHTAQYALSRDQSIQRAHTHRRAVDRAIEKNIKDDKGVESLDKCT